jgi:hypothetical protein
MKHQTQESYKVNQLKQAELWYQDSDDSNLWHGKHGVIVTTTALSEREFYYTVVRIASQVVYPPRMLTGMYV